ncbi:MAG: sugar ABC transporter permease [Aristaeellaceae bacterium]
MRTKRCKPLTLILHHALLALLAALWLIPILWLVLTSFGVDEGPNIRSFFPKHYTLTHYQELLFSADSVSNFPQWFTNTLIVAVFTCVISTAFVLMTAYAMSFLRFTGRRAMMKTAIILNLFPGFLGMIAVYFILRQIGLTNSLPGLILVYSAGAGVDYLIAKGFFDTVSRSLREAAYLEGASEWTVFRRIILPLSKPIVVYTVISSFLYPWMDFVYASIIMSSGITTDKTVSLGLFSMVDKVNRNRYFAQFCAGGVVVSIPISVLFIIMQRFYVEGVTGGSVKG